MDRYKHILKKITVFFLCLFLTGNCFMTSIALSDETRNTVTETSIVHETEEEPTQEETEIIAGTESESTEETESEEEKSSETQPDSGQETETESPSENESELPAESESETCSSPETEQDIEKRPDAPKMKLISTTFTSATIGWKRVKDAEGYLVYVKKGSKWKLVKKTDADTFSYKVKNIRSSEKMTFTVRAFKGNLKSKRNETGIEAARMVKAVTVKSLYISSAGKAAVTWEKNSEADGYLIYRRMGKNGSWMRAGDTDRDSFSESGLMKGKTYYYLVKGYRILNGNRVKGPRENIIKNALHGQVLNNVTKTYLGDSGAGRKMYSYSVGNGKNHMVVISAIHGYEDNWNKDSGCLIDTARKLIFWFSQNTSCLDKYDYQLVVIPVANPDGYYDGYTCNGPGRCTTYRQNAAGKLVKGGLDLNRCFPVGFTPLYNSRNYTGLKPLMANEAKILKAYVDENKGAGKNIFVDMQGWYGQIITKSAGAGILYKALKKYFPSGSAAGLNGNGYIASYAQSVGYDAVLFEFPRNVTSRKAFYAYHYDTRFLSAIKYMMKYS